MGLIQYGDVLVHGNFAKVLPSKPEDFDYMSDAKWIEPYSFDWRETLGSTICNCRQVECHYAPYYGFDYYHTKGCNLLRKLDAEPQIYNLREVYLPAINHYTDAVPNRERIPLYVRSVGRAKSIKVKHINRTISKQISLIE